MPTLGARPLQQLQATEIDRLYVALDGKMSPGTARYVHDVLECLPRHGAPQGADRGQPDGACGKVPSAGESDHGMALDEEQLRALVEGFKGSVLFPIVAVSAFTGARRSEILALRWSDLDADKKTLRIERAVEQLHDSR